MAMETAEHLRQLFEYNDWANRRLITAVKEANAEQALKILAHLLITENEYYERLYGKDSKGFDFWPALGIEECGQLARATAERYEKLLRRFDDEGLNLTARYRTSEGVWCENTFREMLTHVVVHSSIHRGNIMLLLREAGHAPPKIDYIVYLRETKYI
ncbi:MAG: DinB family protein [Acidobacteria bacterium]|nr:DinB family protein [Acidobacteriota bacterium]